MYVEHVRKIDSSEPDDSGSYEYYYEYDIYRFTDGRDCFIARSYTWQPDEAHFLGVEINGNPRTMVVADLKHPLFLLAQSYLRTEGKLNLRWLSEKGPGYESVPAGL